MVRIDLNTPVYVHSGVGRTYTYSGNDYTGVGQFGDISSFDEDSDMTPARLKLSLSGIPYNLNNVLRNEEYQNRAVYIYYAILDNNDNIVRNPILVFKGVTGNVTISYGTSAKIDLDVINQLTLWNKTQNWRYNNQTQQRLYAGDTGLQYVTSAQKGVTWRGVSN